LSATPNAVGNVITDEILKVYPVPANTKLHFCLPVKTSNVSYSITDITGKIQSKNSIENFSENQSVDVSELTRGYYILQVKFDKLTSTVPFLKN
jgi:hypothetical protein